MPLIPQGAPLPPGYGSGAPTPGAAFPSPPTGVPGGGAPLSPAALALGIAPMLAQQANQQQIEQAQLEAQQRAQVTQTLTQALVSVMQQMPSPQARAAQTEPGNPLPPGMGPA